MGPGCSFEAAERRSNGSDVCVLPDCEHTRQRTGRPVHLLVSRHGIHRQSRLDERRQIVSRAV